MYKERIILLVIIFLRLWRSPVVYREVQATAREGLPVSSRASGMDGSHRSHWS